MKKTVKLFLLILFLCPLMFLTACTPPPTYLIEANPSDGKLGSVQGAYNLEALPEGTNITLVAKEENMETNPFICWVKDYKKIVSFDKALNLTYNQTNAGKYIAVFEESLSGMLYSAFSSISIDVKDTEETKYSTINYTLKYARTTSGSSDFTEIETGSFENGTVGTTSLSNLVYFGKPGANYEYKFKIDLVLVSSTGAETSYSVTFTDLLNKNSFNNEGKVEISDYIKDFDAEIKITFDKLNLDLFSTNA